MVACNGGLKKDGENDGTVKVYLTLTQPTAVINVYNNGRRSSWPLLHGSTVRPYSESAGEKGLSGMCP